MNEVVRDGARPAATVRALQTAVSLAWSSGRRLLVAILLATAVTSLTIAMQLLVGRELIDLLAESDDMTARDLAPWLVLLAGLLLVGSVCQAVASELRLPLAEQVQQRAMAEILDVSTEVELEAFEDPRFHDALTRARSAAVGQSSAVVFGLVTVASTLVVSIGIIFVLVAVAPVVVPIAAAGYIPVAIVNMRNNRATYDMEVELTELLRSAPTSSTCSATEPKRRRCVPTGSRRRYAAGIPTSGVNASVVCTPWSRGG